MKEELHKSKGNKFNTWAKCKKQGTTGEIGLLVSDNADYGEDLVIMIQLTSNQSQQ